MSTSVKQLVQKFMTKPPSSVPAEKTKELQEELNQIRAISREKAAKYNATLRKSMTKAPGRFKVVNPMLGGATPEEAENPGFSGLEGRAERNNGNADDGEGEMEVVEGGNGIERGGNRQAGSKGQNVGDGRDGTTALLKGKHGNQDGSEERNVGEDQKKLSKEHDATRGNHETASSPATTSRTTMIEEKAQELVAKRTSLVRQNDSAELLDRVAELMPGKKISMISTRQEDLPRLPSTMSMTSVTAMPEGGYDDIHEAVRLNRPSVSDLLLDPMRGERNFSVTSIGPTVEFSKPQSDSSRLHPEVDIRNVLECFYETYAPEKLRDVDLVLLYFRGRTEALLFTLECKYFVKISAEGWATPYLPTAVPRDVDDEVVMARRNTAMSTATDATDFTTDSFKGYAQSSGIRDEGFLSPSNASLNSGRLVRKVVIMRNSVEQ